MKSWIFKFPIVLTVLFAGLDAYAQTDLMVAQYTGDEELIYPDNLDQWIVVGATLGGDYSEEPLDPENPGTIGVVQMEPNAYRYFLENSEYADGTMFLLSFYAGETTSEPQLQGVVQGDRLLQEIHVIDAQRFSEGRGFFVYRTAGQTSSARTPDGSECVQCHSEHGGLNGTFIQFYPVLRDTSPAP